MDQSAMLLFYKFNNITLGQIFGGRCLSLLEPGIQTGMSSSLFELVKRH